MKHVGMRKTACLDELHAQKMIEPEACGCYSWDLLALPGTVRQHHLQQVNRYYTAKCAMVRLCRSKGPNFFLFELQQR